MRVDSNMAPTKLKLLTIRRSVNHKMWGYISLALNLDGKVYSVGYFVMHGLCSFVVLQFTFTISGPVFKKTLPDVSIRTLYEVL